MSAETLRRAAGQMRANAEKAEQGRWKLWGMQVMADPKGTSNVDDAIPVANAFTPSWCDRVPRTWNANHIASWHPTVALAVADWLDKNARDVYCASPGESESALTVARAYLGEPA